ncbi:DUF7373 family lipoprotein [Nocardia sp. CDC160]|uniref:DUF7373 family lipoprotein n=1 Tax=Nocardia sp. CDC160 TaxID=3112166 RepID=UPI002DB5F4A8|nr:hypothetical protein [Nocardia sp. CDC160]MEC3915412.1 hypothetical protein [Nocardia sp. CDC160]
MHRFVRPTRRVNVGSLSVIAVVGLVGACAIAGTPQAATPELRTLDLGGYSGRPLAAPPNAGETYGRLMESARMADAVVSPRDIDPALSRISAIPVPTPEEVVGILADATVQTLVAHGMLAGFSIGGTDDPTGMPVIDASGMPATGPARSVRLTVLRMRDNMTAMDAARAIDSRDFAVNRDNVDIPFPDYFATHGHWRSYVPTMAATLAHGPFVVSLFITYPTSDRAAMETLVEKTFDAELPRLDAFAPTPDDQLVALPMDPDAMLSRLLPTEPGQWPNPRLAHDEQQPIAGWGGHRSASGVVYGPVVADTWVNRPGDSERIPVESVAITDSARLLRFPDAVAARRALRRLSQPDATHTVATAPSGVPDAVCLRNTDANPAARDSEYSCLVLDGRYLALITASTEADAHHRASAQYALLVTDRQAHG